MNVCWYYVYERIPKASNIECEVLDSMEMTADRINIYICTLCIVDIVP